MTLDALNQRLRKINRPDTAATREGKMNTRADKRFAQVVDIFADVLEPQCSVEKIGLCRANIEWSYQQETVSSQLAYEMKNLLLSRNYDLILESDLPVQWKDHSAETKENLRVTLEYGGKISVKSCAFAVQRGAEQANQLIKALNIPLIQERLMRLQLSMVELERNADEDSIHVRMHTLRGSATWCLLPPVFQLIPMKKQDCIDLIELLQLIYHAVQSMA